MSGQYNNSNSSGQKIQRENQGDVVHILTYTGNQLARRNVSKLVTSVFKNFNTLEFVSSLKHNKREIARLLTSPLTVILLAIKNKTIIGYLIAETTIYENRTLLHIHYLYTVSVHRKKGLASYMLNMIQQYAQEQNIPTLSLTFDTYNQGLTKFYFDQYFEYDPNLRSYQRYDMLVKYV